MDANQIQSWANDAIQQGANPDEVKARMSEMLKPMGEEAIQQGANQNEVNNRMQQMVSSIGPQEEQTSPFMAGVIGFNRQFERYAEGAIKRVAQITGFKRLENAVDTMHQQKESDANIAYAEHPVAYGTGATTAVVGQAIATSPAFAGRGLVGQMVGGTLMGAGMGVLDYSATGEETAMKAGLGAVAGAAAPVVAKGVGKVAEFLRPTKTVADDVAGLAGQQVAGNVDEIAQSTAAANKIGVQLTPAEAIGGEALRAKEVGIPVNEAAKKEIMGVVIPRERKLQKLISESIDNFTPKGRAKTQETVEELYKSFDNIDIDPTDVSMLKNDVILRGRLGKLNNPEFSKYGNISDTNLGKLNALKKNIDSELFNDTFYMVDPSKKMSETEKEVLHSAKDKLLSVLDKTSSYKKARGLAQQLEIQNRYIKLIDKIPQLAGTKAPTVDQLTSKLFDTAEKRAYFLKDVLDTGGNVDNVEALVKVVNQIKGSPLKQLLRSSTGGVTASGLPTSTASLIDKMANATLNKFYNDAVLKLMLGGNRWADQLSQIVASESPKKALGKFILENLPTSLTRQGLLSGVVGDKSK